MIKWLEWENGTGQVVDDDLLRLATEDVVESPQQPEILALARTMRNTGLAWWSGGLSNQPVLLTMELQACHRAEAEYEKIQLDNQRRELEWLAAKAKGTP